jgi:hypothetical protein
MTAHGTDVVECSPGDSAEQQRAELEIVAAFALRRGLALVPTKFMVGDGVCVNVDAVDAEQRVLCEAWAHIGPPKSAQKQKVMTDALKLLLVERHLGYACRKVLLFADVEAHRRFVGKNWMAEALRRFDIEAALEPISDGLRERVVNAQKRQFR